MYGFGTAKKSLIKCKKYNSGSIERERKALRDSEKYVKVLESCKKLIQVENSLHLALLTF